MVVHITHTHTLRWETTAVTDPQRGMSSSGEAVFRAVETPLFWLGALTAAWLSVCSVYRLLSGIRVWVLGNGRLVSPTKLGKWAVVTGAEWDWRGLCRGEIKILWKFSD
ncbi:very-long-chain 3-oxoacyl-CoA reductase-B-like protein [Lates japonicus]|uniref:Very-long-chain 3-oxoacyl-CoA reductase-B-like protein n=1 Tax=Lates japonicus TaxID=270547 RepID=A0AAD3MJ89_LATJO|nr:very-long-chain 3-oxoacyl-CoA reductase-B-like protein [Lates japonicus]